MHLSILLEGLVDIQKEKQRLLQEIDSFKKQLKAKQALLNNKNFVKRAPKEVVSNEKKRCGELVSLIEKTKAVKDAFK